MKFTLTPCPSLNRDWISQLETYGHVRVRAVELHPVLLGTQDREDRLAKDWLQFAQSWDGMSLDQHMADGGTYRRRRFSVVEVELGQVVVQPHQPHFQSRAYNGLNGGIERWFDPVLPGILSSVLLRDLIRLSADLFDQAQAQVCRWRVEMHQFRIEAHPGQKALPTPEGAHRDGVDYVMVLLVHRQNLREGVTQIFQPDGQLLGQFTLGQPMEAVFLNDHRVLHGVTAIEPLDPHQPAWRDVLVLTFRRLTQAD